MGKAKKNDTAYPEVLYVKFTDDGDSQWFQAEDENTVGAFFTDAEVDGEHRVARYKLMGFSKATKITEISVDE